MPSEVDAAFDSVGECVECADDVVPVKPEIQSEVISGPGGNADVGDVFLHGDGRDQCLRPVASCHSDDIRSPCGRPLGETAEVVAWTEQQGLDAPPPRLFRQVETRSLSVAGAGVDDQHARSGWLRWPRMAMDRVG